MKYNKQSHNYLVHIDQRNASDNDGDVPNAASTRLKSLGRKLFLFQLYKLPLSSDTITP